MTVGRGALINGLHLLVLSAFALAQPLLDILGKNPTFFAVRGSTSTEIVRFAVALVFLPPLVLWGIELVVGLASRPAATIVHLVFVSGLAALVALHVVTRTESLSGVAAVALAAAVGVGAGFLYHRARAARSILTVLSPVPFLFLALFLVQSPASKLVFAKTPVVPLAKLESAAAAQGKASTPVVLIVFDEFNSASLMDQDGRLDAVRYPNFARLAASSVWYRNASTVYFLSEGAQPAILTGKIPTPETPPIASEYPESLFTLLGRTHRVRAIETIARLCPQALCKDSRNVQAAVTGDVAGSLPSDVGIVYLHMLLPRPYASRLPPIDDSWGNFAGSEKQEPASTATGAPHEACGRGICEASKLIEDDGRPTFYFFDSLLPHTPYIYLPSGRRYAIDARVLRGLVDGFWSGEWPTLQSEQRYLLQVGYTDSALGVLMRKLKASGVWDKALVIVTADHGVSLRPGDRRRLPTPTNLEDIAMVPLFVKLPGQEHGRVDNGFARIVDVVPTIADVLGMRVPWPVDGRSLVTGQLPAQGMVSVHTHPGVEVQAPLAVIVERRARRLARQAGLFGTGSFAGVYRIGPNRELVGRRVATLRVTPRPALSFEIEGRSLLDAVVLDSGFAPTFVEGTLTGAPPGELQLAVAVNGKIAAVTRSYEQYGQKRFSAMVPEAALRSGANDVEVFVVDRAGSALTLQRLRSADTGLTLGGSKGHETITSGSGHATPVTLGELQGAIAVTGRGTEYVFRGRAAAGKQRVDLIAVFVDGTAVFVGRAKNLRPRRILGESDLGLTGVEFELPRAIFPQPGPGHDVRIFVLKGGVASEVGYSSTYPWPRP